MTYKNTFKNIDFTRIGFHVLFWVILSVFYDFVSSYLSNQSFFETLLHDLLFFFPSDILGVYFTLYLLIPKFLLKKKYIRFTVYFFIFLFFLMIVITMPLQYYGMYISRIDANKLIPSFFEYLKRSILIALTLKLMIIGIATTIKLAKIWFNSQKKQQNLVNEKLEIKLQLKEAELKFLKSQINPHFLFNALNNLYSLILENSPKAPGIVLKISSLMDYVLYKCNVQNIELLKEIENIKNYIDLQKIRYSDKVNIIINVEGDPCKINIAPLLILPLIENAFKHGLDKNVGNGFIEINFNISDDRKFNLVVTNSLNGENNHTGEGIGISNLRKRLELQYPQKFQLNLQTIDNTFIAELCIDFY